MGSYIPLTPGCAFFLPPGASRCVSVPARIRRAWRDAALFASWLNARWAAYPMSLAEVRRMSGLQHNPELARAFEYGMMLVETSAVLWYTIQLCQRCV